MPARSTKIQVLEAPAEMRAEFHRARQRRHRAAKRAMRLYYQDPVAFAHDCFEWPDDQGLTPYQEEVLSDLVDKRRVAQRGPHGLGKTTTGAISTIWFSTTRDALEVDWKAITTAGAWRQLERYLWPEIHKWVRLMRWDRVGRDPFAKQLLNLSLQLEWGSAFAVASSDAALIEGAHADSLFYLFDESKAISDATFDAAEGAFSGGPGTEALALASSTPGEPVGRFYDIHARRPGLEDWHTRHVTVDEAISAGRISPDWVERRRAQWGEQSALFHNRVLGEFHADDELGVIPLAWIEQAVERWYEQAEYVEEGTADRLGVDVARSGADSTVIAVGYRDWVDDLRYYDQQMTMQTAGLVCGLLEANPAAEAVIDTDGLGAGVTDRVEERFPGRAVAFHASGKTDKTDESGELTFVNVRSAAWWNVREQLDPALDPVLALPDDPRLIGELTAPRWKITSNSRVQVESKDDIKKRLSGRSTDAADAVIHLRWRDRQRKRRRMVHAGRAA